MLMEEAKRNNPHPLFKAVAEQEGVPVETIMKGVASGRMVVPANVNHKDIDPRAIGEGLRVKINANIGTSKDFIDVDEELRKADVAVKYGADAVMDLSTGGEINKIRKTIIDHVRVPIGTVPIYQAGLEKALSPNGAVVDLTSDDLFNAIRNHALDGVDFITVHCGITKQTVKRLCENPRTTDVVSRGGSFLTAWILQNEQENPLYAEFDYLLEICKEYEMTLSLGDGMRPGGIADSTDHAQIEELMTLGELVKRSRAANVQAMVEGPGHIPVHQIEANVHLQKSLCDGAPFYVLGPLVTDIAPGYDHIVGAIGGTIAAQAGADFLCYVTPAEHLSLPTIEDVRDGVIASKIAAHAVDLIRGIDLDKDHQMDVARRDRDWDKMYALALDPEKAKERHEERLSSEDDVCSMCGELCAIKITEEYLRPKKDE